MRILHTSDWHVGRTLHGQDLLAEQEAVLGELAETVAREAVQVVLVSGDLYDRAVPSGEAVGVCTRAMARIREAGAALVVTPGNHDSAARVGAFGRFAAAGGLHLRTRIDELASPVLFTDEHGPVAIYGIPYLEPESARYELGAPELRGHTEVLDAAMQRVRADLAEREPGTRSVVLAHAFVTGAEGSQSERNIAVGGVEDVPGSVFNGVDYVALGHLHGPQRLAEHLRYSGSPLAYSFGEAAQHKSVWLLDLDATGLAEARRHYLPVPRELATVTGTMDELLGQLTYEPYVDCFLSIRLTDRVRPVDPMRRLRERFPYALHLEWHPAAETTTPLRYAAKVRGADDPQLAARFLADCRGAKPTRSERALFDDAFAALRAGEGD